MSSLQTILGVILAAFLAYAFYRYTLRRAAQQAEHAHALFADLFPLLQNADRNPGESIGSWNVTGRYRDNVFQFQTITDTMAVRKLPSLWLMVTLPKPQPVAATFDFMMRPAAATTFSKFDFLQHTLPLPDGFPEEGVLRSDGLMAAPDGAMRLALSMFRARRGKELLVSPKGLRIVCQLAEADRARYGVYREARFSDARIDASLANELMNTLLQLEADLAKIHD
jgi:hypothetical protein